jgi:hypothetical protein
MKILERERVCLEILKKLPQKFVLVGGYATSSFDFPRFSVDLDLVIRGADVPEFKRNLQEEGFRLTTDRGEFAIFYKGRMMRFEKKVDELPVSVDLLSDMIQARQTNTAYSFDYLWENSEPRRVTSSGAGESVETRVATREMLIALKINSMRMADQRDIIALCSGKVDAAKVINHLKRSPKEKILDQLKIIIATLENPSSKDSIKGVFGIPYRAYEKLIEKARREILAITNAIFDWKQPKK